MTRSLTFAIPSDDVQKRANVEIPKEVHRAFSDAIQHGDVGKARELINQHGSLVNPTNWAPPPLHCAVLWNQPAVAEILIASGANLEALDPDRQTTALRYAIMYARPQMLQLLIEHGANLGKIHTEGQTALELAQSAAEGDYEEYADMPRREEYRPVLALLSRLSS